MNWIKKAYLYVVSVITLVMMIFAATIIVNLGIKALVKVEDYSYPAKIRCMDMKSAAVVEGEVDTCNPEYLALQEETDRKNEANNKKRDLSQSLAILIVATPVFLYHWKLARKEA